MLLTLGIAFAVSALVLYVFGCDSRTLSGIGGDAAEACQGVWALDY